MPFQRSISPKRESRAGVGARERGFGFENREVKAHDCRALYERPERCQGILARSLRFHLDEFELNPIGSLEEANPPAAGHTVQLRHRGCARKTWNVRLHPERAGSLSKLQSGTHRKDARRAAGRH